MANNQTCLTIRRLAEIKKKAFEKSITLSALINILIADYLNGKEKETEILTEPYDENFRITKLKKVKTKDADDICEGAECVNPADGACGLCKSCFKWSREGVLKLKNGETF
jgi:hypothetical protein